MEERSEQVLAFLKGEMSAEEQAAFQEVIARSPAMREELERSRDLLRMLEAASEQAVDGRVSALIERAIRERASDIHVVPAMQDVTVWLRIGGVLSEVETYPKGLHDAVVDRWKVLSDCSVTERKAPQDGRMMATFDDKEYGLRVNITPTITGERITARVLARSDISLSMDSLHIPPDRQAEMIRLVERPNGIVLVVGPTGSGKTTMLYSLLMHLTTSEREHQNILSIEDPVEYLIKGVSQVQVDMRAGVTFESAMRAFLRSDPDVIMAGEICNLEIAELAVSAAVTGHLVLSTLHTPDAVSAITRLLNIGVEPYMAADALKGIIAMRLVRVSCPECIAEYQPDPADLRALGLSDADGPFRHGTGCQHCQGHGYYGRRALLEVLEVDDSLRPLIAERAPEQSLRRAIAGRHANLWDAARAMVHSGETTVEEALRVLARDTPR